MVTGPRAIATILVRTAWGMAAVGAAMAGTPRFLDAMQDPSRPAGWLGVSVNQQVKCVWETSEDWKACDLVMQVQGVKQGSPAQTGGIRPGDQIVAVNGEAVTYASASRLFGQIRPGTPVSIDVMRGGERYFVHVVPSERPEDSSSGVWVRAPARIREGSSGPEAFVVTLTRFEPREGGGAFALTIRDAEDHVVVEPAALSVIGGQLRLVPLDESAFEDLPDLRIELVGDLRGIEDSLYRRATSAFQVMDAIRQRVSSEEFRGRLARVARVGLEETRLVTRVVRSFGGAEFETAPASLASAVDAGREGLLVLRVAAGTPAARMGLRPGDVLFEADGKPVREMSDLVRAVRARRGTVELRWARKGEERSGRFPPR